MNTLINIYCIHSPSKKEGLLSKYIQSLLDKAGIEYKVDKHHQIYNIKPNKPLICAHIDQVQQTICEYTVTHNDYIYGFNNHKQVGLGADDKNGVWILLKLLQKYPDLSFIFSAQEETGGKIYDLCQDIDISNTPYALIFDRKGGGDIIGASNNYCCDDLEQAIATIGRGYGYKPAQGIYSDCDALSEYIPCVNLSCGYYNAHTDNEYTNINELINALEFGKALINDLPRQRYELPEKTIYEHNYKTIYEHNYLMDIYENNISIYDNICVYVDRIQNEITIDNDITSKVIGYERLKNNTIIEVQYEEVTIILEKINGEVIAYAEDESLELIELDVIEF